MPEGLPPRVIGHRGAAAHAPENTLAGFRAAHELGARWVEFDVQATRDGHPILLHDARLERTTDGRGIAASLTAAEIGGLDAGSWFAPRFRGERVPRLEAALDLLDELGLGAVVEVKAERGDGIRTLGAALPALRRSKVPMILTSFEEDALAVAADAAPHLPRALAVGKVPADWAARVERLRCAAIHVGERRLGDTMVAALARALPCRVYTVNSPARARQLFTAGAAGVFTDYPDVILSCLGDGSLGRAARGQAGRVW